MVRNFNHKAYMDLIVRNYNIIGTSGHKEVKYIDEED
jgi:hypothetical protein